MDNKDLPNVATHTFASEVEETFELDPEQEAQLLSAIAEADGGELISALDLLERIRHL